MVGPQKMEFQTGDVLLYSPSSPIGVWIAIKTWTWLSHVEVYHGSGMVIAARPEGVNIYPVRLDKYLYAVRRVKGVFYDQGAFEAVETYLGKPYEKIGLMWFYNPWAKHVQTTRICSSIVNRYLIGGGAMCFNPLVPDSRIAPAQLWQTAVLSNFWVRGNRSLVRKLGLAPDPSRALS